MRKKYSVDYDGSRKYKESNKKNFDKIWMINLWTSQYLFVKYSIIYNQYYIKYYHPCVSILKIEYNVQQK